MNADVLVIGAGFIGLSVAHALRQQDSGLRVLVVDAADFAAGGSGRNGAGIRMQWSRDFNIQLSKDSLETFENAEALFGYRGGIDLRQHGYLILAHSDAVMANLVKAVAVQQRCGVPSQILSPQECQMLQPGLNVDGVHGAAFCAKDGVASPFKWLDALLKANRRCATQVVFGCRVLSLCKRGGDFLAATNASPICAHRVVLCTDWAAPELLAPFGVHLPIARAAKEAMVTEASAPLVQTTLMVSQQGLGVKQLARGNIILTLTRPNHATAWDDTPDYQSACAQAAIRILPQLAEVHMLRKWTGVISKTPDMQPIIGETDVAGLFVAVSAYKGFMMSPAIGRIMANLVISRHSTHMAADVLSPARFAKGELVPETLTI